MSVAGSATRHSDTFFALSLDAAMTLSAALAMALASRLVIPIGPVPITAQTLAVLLVGGLLGSRRGAAGVTVFLFAGAAGVPLFAFGGGASYLLLSPTAGYIVGFLPAAFVMGWLVENGWDRSLGRIMSASGLCLAIIYCFGLLRLAQFPLDSDILSTGLYPFLPGEAFKTAMAAVAVWGFRPTSPWLSSRTG